MAERNAHRVVEITQNHIDTAIPKDSSHCMISDALKESIPGATRISTDLATIRYSKDGKRYIFATPRIAQIALLQFDEGVKMKPFRFRLHHALQIIPTRGTRPGEGPPRAARRAKVDDTMVARREVPTITGGVTPPVGSLAHGAIGPKPKWTKGTRREFGLRAMATRGVVDKGE